MKQVLMLILTILPILINAQTVTTTTISGNLKVNDSLHVVNNISTTGDVKATGEVVSKDTMRAQKDIIVDGNAKIAGNISVGGSAIVNALRVGGPLTLGPLQQYIPNPCLINMMVATPLGDNVSELTPLSPTQIHDMELAYDTNPCQVAAPLIIPFTWQTYGNHVNSSNRWIGTIENFDFNIKTNNNYQVVCKASGDIGLGAFGGNAFNTINKKYKMYISNSGEISAGIQDVNNKYSFTIKPTGATYIGFGRPLLTGIAANAMLSVDGLILAKEVRIAVSTSTHWADYVFDKTYKLMPLKEVETFIKTNKHLPEVPSSKEVQENGIDITEISVTLLKKIEELTLYTIELQKKVDAQQEEINSIKNK